MKTPSKTILPPPRDTPTPPDGFPAPTLYIRLEVGDDCARKYLARPGVRVTRFGTCSERDCALRFVVNRPVRIRWPNGHQAAARVAFEQRVGGCSDMGRATTVKYNYPGFLYSINGVYRFIGLDEVEVWEPDLPERTPENAAMFGGREVVAVDGVEVGPETFR